jgi:hypothetical protein
VIPLTPTELVLPNSPIGSGRLQKRISLTPALRPPRREFKSAEEEDNDTFGPLVISPALPAKFEVPVEINSVSPNNPLEYDLSALLLGHNDRTPTALTDDGTSSDTSVYNAVVQDSD